MSEEQEQTVCLTCGAILDGDCCLDCTDAINEAKASLAVLVDTAREARDTIQAVKDEMEPRLKEAKVAMIPLLERLEQLTGKASYKDDFGTTTLVVYKPSVSYSGKLDDLLEQYPWLRGYRKESQRSPSVRLG